MIGGALLSLGGEGAWRIVFAMNLPLGALALWILARRVGRDAAGSDDPLDWAGALLATLALGLGAWAFTAGAGGPPTWALAGAAAAALAGFVAREARARHPMMPLGLFADRTFAAANLATFLLYFALSAVLFYLPQTVIAGWGRSAAEMSTVFVPFSAAMAVLGPVFGRLADRVGPGLPIAGGAAVVAVAFAGLALTAPMQAFWAAVLPLMALMGIGMSAVVSPLSTAVMGAAPDEATGAASGINNAVSRMAGLVAVAAMGALAARAYGAAGGGGGVRGGGGGRRRDERRSGRHRLDHRRAGRGRLGSRAARDPRSERGGARRPGGLIAPDGRPGGRGPPSRLHPRAGGPAGRPSRRGRGGPRAGWRTRLARGRSRGDLVPMREISQNPTDPAFVQDPYPFYARARALGPLVRWREYGMPVATTHAAVIAILRDRRLGRQAPVRIPPAPHLAPFYRIEADSMLELEPPRHTRLRGLVLRAFTSRRVAALAPAIEATCHELLDAMPPAGDLLAGYCRPVPVRAIARLLGVPEADAPDLLRWSTAMVAMYQAGRTRAHEGAAAEAAEEFAGYVATRIAEKRAAPAEDLLTDLVRARDEDDALTDGEMAATAILLLNAGHEATVHALGGAVAALLEAGAAPEEPARAAEERLRHDPPLHVFTRWAYEDVECCGETLRAGEQVGCLLASAGRDPAAHADPDRFDPTRAPGAHAAFGGGIHFCVGAPLARLEMEIALRVLWDRRPGLRLAAPPRYAPIYHFRGLERLLVTTR